MMMEPARDEPYLPLRGLRVLSFEVAFSLPAGTRTLAELGAEVVRVAGPERSAGYYIGVVDGVFLSKECVGINLRHSKGREIAAKLARQADIVAYNFTPQVMRKFGLSPAVLLAMKPALIVLQLSGYGTPGPWSEFPAFGPSTEAAGGLNSLTGGDQDPPVRVGSGVFGDQLAGRYAALALVAAIEHRLATGAGGVIDLSMSECVTTLLGPEMVEHGRTGLLPVRHGNRHPEFAPQGVYPCAGTDEWVAISVTSDEMWKAFAAALGEGLLLKLDWATAERRHDAHDEIDQIIALWTGSRDKHAVAAHLQAGGVAAGPVRKPSESLFDPHLAERGAFHLVEHARPLAGFWAHPHLANPWGYEGHTRSLLTDYRPTGSDNEAVLERWLGLEPTQTAALLDEGALLTIRDFTVAGPSAPEGTPIDQDFGALLGLPTAAAATR